MNLPRIRFFRQATTVVLAAALAACGGGDGNDGSTSPTTQTLGGTAAVGAPIVGGSVAVNCAGGDALSATTSSTGTWTVTIAGQTLPCAVQVSGGTVGGSASTVKLHSVALAFDGTVNLTPLTDLAVAKLVAGDPAAWFAKPVFTGVDQTALADAVKALATSLGLADALGSTDPFTAAFEAKAGDAVDDLLEALQAALGALSKTYAALLGAAAGDFSAFSGFPAAIEVALGGGAGACTAGTELTYTQSVTGAPYTNGQKVCFEASATTLKFSGKTLTDPVKNETVAAPYSAYAFADGALTYEVVFNDGALYEINVVGTSFLGQFKSAAGGGSGGALTVQVVAGGTSAPPITVDGVPAPAGEAEFCGSIETDATFASIGASSGGTLEIVGCSYADKVGTVSASVTVGGITVDYLVTYTWE